ncbi:metacaspase-3-like [Pistacia vera]|uniref:metacaspase-3-like n=1 Tax=Pistacia vera TaxID=55513 RepID=UPI001263BFC8|nr:metacaspase-3-like [Pistacia vera]
MASRSQQCGGCGVYHHIPPHFQSFCCPACRAITWVRPYEAGGLVNIVNNTMPIVQTETYPAPRPALPAPPAYGKKRAVLCGVSYLQTTYKLKGSINDVQRMKYLLVEKLKFPSECVVTLTEEERDPMKIPTKQNILTAMRWLVQNCQAGDSLVFYFSGHGHRQIDCSEDEPDGFDEALCPLDHATEGLLVDDEINETIVRPLPHGAKLHAIVDASNSGTVLDLPLICRMKSEGFYEWEDQTYGTPRPIYKGTRGGLAVCFSACDDDQSAARTPAFTGKMAGALTFSFTQTVHNEPVLTYGRLLNAIRSSFRKNNQSNQEPLLTSSARFDVYSKKFIL